MRVEYRRRKGSDCWHYHRECHWYPHNLGPIVSGTIGKTTYERGEEQASKPTTGEFCNECRAKTRRHGLVAVA